MKTPTYKVKIGIIGCGAIGSRMAKYITRNLNKDARVIGLYDIDPKKIQTLRKSLKLENIATDSFESVLTRSDCLVEAVNTNATLEIVKKTVKAGKSVLAMSVGRLLNAPHLFEIARKNKCYIMLPSGAIAGIDAIKAASLERIKSITLTTRKPPRGLMGNPYLEKKGINLSKIKKETVLFRGSVGEAVKRFPQNINVAAAIALACGDKRKLKIRIITSPKFKRNSHEIDVIGDFGRMVMRTDNLVCPDNPKTSYLAVLSGLETLKQYCTGIVVGT